MSNSFIFLIITLFVGVIDICTIEFSFKNDKHYSIGWITVAFIVNWFWVAVWVYFLSLN